MLRGSLEVLNGLEQCLDLQTRLVEPFFGLGFSLADPLKLS
jgi:hypothetical protein